MCTRAKKERESERKALILVIAESNYSHYININKFVLFVQKIFHNRSTNNEVFCAL